MLVNKENNDIQRAQRERYMNHEISHNEYYLWLADFIGVTADLIPFQIEQIKASQDSSLNDLPLSKWDMQDLAVRRLAGKKGLSGWSLSDTVCTLKTFARKQAGIKEMK